MKIMTLRTRLRVKFGYPLLGIFATRRKGISDWIVYTIAGEVQRLLTEFPQNQELVDSIGPTLYQVIYPTQLRRHEKMGISTRETVPTKVSVTINKERRNDERNR